MKPILFALVMFLAQGPATQGVATVQGAVVRAGSGAPVVRARVTLSSEGSGAAPISVSTDDRGSFRIPNVAAGRYRMSVSRDGFVPAEYGQRAIGRPGTAFTLAARQEMKDVLIELNPAGTIAGKVVDRYGEPMANATVQSLKYGYDQGHRVLRQVQSAKTDELGAYRLFWMQAGQYVVSARSSDPNGNAATAVAIASDLAKVETLRNEKLAAAIVATSTVGAPTTETGEALVPIYYPGTPDVSAATPIDLRPGDVVSGVNFTVNSVHAIHIRGVVINGTTGQVSAGTPVTLALHSTVGIRTAVRTATASDIGVFEFRDVPQGSYDISTSGGAIRAFLGGSITGPAFTLAGGNALSLPAPGGSNAPLFSRTTVEVGAADIDNVTLTMRPGINIPGQIMVDGGTSGSSAGNASVQLVPNTSTAVPQPSSPPASVDANGAFTLTGVGPGDFRVNVVGIPRNMFLKSVRLGATDVLTTGLHIDGDLRGQLEIVLGANPASVDAVVLDDRQQPVTGETVVLVPISPQRQRMDVYKSGTTDDNGHVRFDAIVPGDYKLFAWDDAESGAWTDPDFIKMYEDRGRGVHLSENGRENVSNLRPIPQK